MSRAPQIVELPPDDVVTLAGAGLKAWTVDDVDDPAGVSDEDVGLADGGASGQRYTAHSQHLTEKVLCEGTAWRAHPVRGHEEPPGGALARMMQTIAGDVLRQLHHCRLEETVELSVQDPIGRQHLSEVAGLESEGLSGDLAERGVRAGQ